MDFYLGELLLRMVDLSNIIQTFIPMIRLSLWNHQKGPGKLGTTFYFHLEAGAKFWMDFYLTCPSFKMAIKIGSPQSQDLSEGV